MERTNFVAERLMFLRIMNEICKQGHIRIHYLDQMDQPEPLKEIILADE
jgi:hypothetical protein